MCYTLQNKPMKILTLNTWYRGERFENIKKFLVDERADFYFLQEVFNGNRQDLNEKFRAVNVFQKLFPTFHFYFSAAILDTRKKEGDVENGQLLMSRWPFTSTEALFVDVPYGAYDEESMSGFSNFPSLIPTGTVSIDGKMLTLCNVHGPVNLKGREDDQRRLRMRDILLGHITEHTIIAGDFNVCPETQTIRSLEDRLTNVFKGKFETTFNTKWKDLKAQPGYATAVVDYVFVSKGIRVMRALSPKVDVSDHMPLAVEVEIVSRSGR